MAYNVALVGAEDGSFVIYCLSKKQVVHRSFLRPRKPVKFVDINHTTGDVLFGSESTLQILTNNGVVIASFSVNQEEGTIQSALLKSSLEQQDDNVLILALTNNHVQFYTLRPSAELDTEGRNISHNYREKYSHSFDEAVLKS